MLENPRRISSPLTIMGMFAVLTELCASVVLPSLSPEIQAVFVWFVMAFPFALLLLFFLVLIIRPQSIYAPSDFRDEENFLRAIFPATPAEREAKVRSRMEALTASGAAACPASPPGSGGEEARSRFSLVEERAMNRIALDIGLPVVRNMRLDTGSGGHVFDGLAREPERVKGIEVLYLHDARGAEEVFMRALGAVERDIARMGAAAEGRFALMLALVLEQGGDGIRELEERLRDGAEGAPFPVEVRVFSVETLERELAAAAGELR